MSRLGLLIIVEFLFWGESILSDLTEAKQLVILLSSSTHRNFFTSTNLRRQFVFINTYVHKHVFSERLENSAQGPCEDIIVQITLRNTHILILIE